MAGRLKFPEGFLWGTASAAHQVEGDNRNSDWWQLELEPGRIRDGDTSLVACDHYRRFREDFGLIRELNNNAHRLSIEWARIEPRPGEFDAEQIEHYREVLTALRQLGIAPMLTLHHFTSPLWFARRGGWASVEAPAAFERYVRRVADELGELVDLWCTINEPNIYAAQGWFNGEFPPAHHGDLPGYYRVLKHMRLAHERAYRVLHARTPERPVGLSFHKFLMLPASRRDSDVGAAMVAQMFIDRWPAGLRTEPIVAGLADYVGIAHYWAQVCTFNPRRPQDAFIRRENVPGAIPTDMGWTSDPAWLRPVLNELRDLGKPVYVTENGISTGDDGVRQEYLTAALRSVHGAIEDGVDVRGYFHWTLLDNFEWAHGYAQKFGLVAVDRSTLERTVKKSGRVYAEIAGSNSVPAA
ncbi:MAG TPA: glycoside hydrolase family 1 protein [Candidatus Dormibacteraeota bacterium]